MEHPLCFERLAEIRRAGAIPERLCWMSSEDTLARADAIKFADAHVPMALDTTEPKLPPCPEKPKPPRKPKLTQEQKDKQAEDRARARACQKGYKLALSLAEKERKARERAAAREIAKAQRAEERVAAKEAERFAKIQAAEGGEVELPAVVLRDGTVRHVSDSDAWAVIEMYLAELFIDVEHSGFPFGHELYELRTVQLGGEMAAIVFDAADPRQMDIVKLALALAVKLRSFSSTADNIPCVLAGLSDWESIWAKTQDGVLDVKLADPKMAGSDADALKELSADILREYAVSPNAEKAKNALFAAMGCIQKPTVETPPHKNGWNMVNKFSKVMARYAGSDVLDLAAVLRVLPPLSCDPAVMEREKEFQAACAPISWQGFALDEAHIRAKIDEEEAAKKASQEAVEILSDKRITNPKSTDVLKYLPEIIPGLVLPIRRKANKSGIKTPTADKGALEGLCRDYKDDPLAFHLMKQILAYRHHDTTLSLLLRPLLDLCVHGDSRMRPTVYTIEASTGRSSCRRPNGQQFSRQGGIRACVIAGRLYLAVNVYGEWIYADAETGELLEMRGISADFEGCEIRVAAGLSQDADLLAAETSNWCHRCLRNDDLYDPCSCPDKDNGERGSHTGLHWMAAHAAFGNGATKEHRYWCKRGIFCKLFGGGADTAASQVYCDVSSMTKVFKAFEDIAQVYTKWDWDLRKLYKAGSYVWRDYQTGEQHSMPIEGQNRMIYQAYSGRPIYIRNGEHAAGNGAIQGTAREVLVDGTLNWRKTKWGRLAILPVHDQLIGFVPAHEAEQASLELVRCMETTVLSTPRLPIKIGADVDRPFISWPDSS